MTRIPVTTSRLVIAAALILAFAAGAAAQAGKTIQLPPPQKTGGRPLMQVLNDRQSGREFTSEPLPQQVLSNLLWAGWGISRADGRRTAPSASNRQEIDVYVAMADGLYLYDAKPHALKLIVTEDLRAATGTQPFPAEAALNLVFVADLARIGTSSTPDRSMYNGANTGYISENIYLFCASEGLATVVRASIDRPALAKKMQLRDNQQIVLAQSVGYPKKK